MAQSTSEKKKSTSSKKKQTGTEKPKSSGRAKKQEPIEPVKPNRSHEIFAILFGALTLLMAIGMFSDGRLVVGINSFFGGLLGWGFLLMPFAFAFAAIIQASSKLRPAAWRTASTMLAPVFIGAFADLVAYSQDLSECKTLGKEIITLYEDGAAMEGGGVISGLIYDWGSELLGSWGAGIVLFIIIAALIMGICNTNIVKIIKWYRARPRFEDEEPEEEPLPEHEPVSRRKKPEPAAAPAAEEERPSSRRRISAFNIDIDNAPSAEPEEDKPFVKKKKKAAPVPVKTAHTEKVVPLSVEEAAAVAGVTPFSMSGSGETEAAEISDPPKKKLTKQEVEQETAAISSEIAENSAAGEYEHPPIYLLKKGHANLASADEELRANYERLESTIQSFGVNAHIVSYTHGPTVTRYDLELEQGVKLSRLTNLAGDIALQLGVVSVRIAPIPDKISTVGIEVPNKLISTVYLRDIIDSPNFQNAKSRLSFAIGKDIGGEAIVGNISKLPHLLIAGTTGSGKSVCMNSLIISLLYKADPDEVKLIMIDPKMVELGVYNGIPHLYIPVVTDPKKAAGALQWAVTEMLKRYRLFSEVGVRSLAGYNEHLEAEGKPKMPSVVVVIDELADLMLVASKEVEESICRVAQMGRAAGMHLIIATQRPSADVITGLMKANIPSRIAFAVSSALESRIILDNAGAEKLIGMGDMLYAPIGCGKPLRVQGAFVSDEERDDIVRFIKEQGTATYNEDIVAQIEKAAEEKNQGGKSAEPEAESKGGDFDELLPQAVDVIFDTKQASVSMLQRRLKLGYSRAARIVDQMEEMGIIGAFEGSKPRQILITREQWLEMQTVSGTAPTEILRTQTEFSEELD